MMPFSVVVSTFKVQLCVSVVLVARVFVFVSILVLVRGACVLNHKVLCAVQLVFPNATTSTSCRVCTHGSRIACVRRVAHSLQLLRWCPRQHNAPRRVLRAL